MLSRLALGNSTNNATQNPRSLQSRSTTSWHNLHLKVVTWDVNLLRKKHDMVSAIMQIVQLRIFFLQATMMEDSEYNKLVFPLQYF